MWVNLDTYISYTIITLHAVHNLPICAIPRLCHSFLQIYQGTGRVGTI